MEPLARFTSQYPPRYPSLCLTFTNLATTVFVSFAAGLLVGIAVCGGIL